MFSTVKMVAGVGAVAVAAAMFMAQKVEHGGAGALPGAPAAAIPASAIVVTAATPKPGGATRRASGGGVTLTADGRGHYFAPVEINGRVATMMVDTGASTVALSADDVRKLGVIVPSNAPKVQISTANGVIAATRMILPEVRLDTITVRDVEATLLPEGVRSVSLLGMSFMAKLSSFQVNDGELSMKP